MSERCEATSDEGRAQRVGTRVAKRRARRGIRLALLLVGALLVLPASWAWGQEPVREIRELYTQGLEQYDFFEYEEAKKLFDQAIEVANQNRVDDPFMAKVYVARGILYYAQFKDTALAVAENKAREAFIAAVAIDSQVQLDELYTTPELEKLLDEARGIAGDGGTGGTGGTGGGEQLKITHQPLSVARGGEPVAFRVVLPDDPRVFNVRVQYRMGASGESRQLQMRPGSEPGVFIAELPAERIEDSNIFYYIEVLDQGQAILGSAGSPARPFQVNVLGDTTVAPSETPLMTIGLGGGIGVGLASGESDNCGETPACYGDDPARFDGIGTGMARSSFFLVTDFMFYILPELQVGVYGRFQLEPETESVMAGAKLRYFLLPGESNRLYTGLVIGGGQVRYLVDLGEEFNDFTDVVTKGPVHVGVNAGYMLSFNEHVGLQIDLLVPVHFPDFTFHIDFTGGPFFQF